MSSRSSRQAVFGSAKWWEKRLQNDQRVVKDLGDESGGICHTIERIFAIRERNTTISREVKAGFLHFVSVAFILSVNSRLLSENTSYSSTRVAASTALVTGMACLISGLLSNLPFILAPTTSTSIYYAIYLQNHNLSPKEGNLAVFLLGVLFGLLLLGLGLFVY
jgi:AGZA family xanthine/uracil permease-like MFS transporter